MFLPNSVRHGEQAACYPEISGPVKADKNEEVTKEHLLNVFL